MPCVYVDTKAIDRQTFGLSIDTKGRRGWLFRSIRAADCAITRACKIESPIGVLRCKAWLFRNSSPNVYHVQYQYLSQIFFLSSLSIVEAIRRPFKYLNCLLQCRFVGIRYCKPILWTYRPLISRRCGICSNFEKRCMCRKR